MDGATLNINFRDESLQGQGSPAQTPQAGGTTAAPSLVEQQQQAITQAGGVRQRAEQQYSQATTTTSASIAQPSVATAATVPVATPLPTPISTAVQPSGEAALAQSVQRIVGADPKATAEEIAKLLGGGIGARDVERLMRPAPPPAEPIPSPPVQPTTVRPSQAVDSLIFPADLRRADADRWIESERQRFAQEQREEAVRQRQQQEAAARNIPRPPPLSREQILSEAEANAPPVQNAPLNVTSQVQTTVNAISHFAHMAGPLGSATAGLVNTAVAMPAVAQALGTAAPALVAAAPYVALAAAAAAVPVAAGATLVNEANRAIAVSRQFSPEVIGAEAQAGVRQIMADIRSAQRLGDEAAQLVDARSRASAAVQGIRDILSEPVLGDFARFNNAIARAAETLNNLADRNPTASEELVRKAVDTLGTSLFGPGYLFYKGVGGVFGKPSETFATIGLTGAIPNRPKLPPPFEGVEASEQTLTISGLPSGLRGINPGSRP